MRKKFSVMRMHFVVKLKFSKYVKSGVKTGCSKTVDVHPLKSSSRLEIQLKLGSKCLKNKQIAANEIMQ